METVDIYSRIETYNAVQLQYNLACEDLVRKHFGLVKVEHFSARPKEKEQGWGREKISEVMKEIKRSCKPKFLVGDEGEQMCYCLSEHWVGRISVDYQEDSRASSDEEAKVREESRASGGEDSGRKTDRFLQSVSVELYLTESTISKKIKKCFTDLGFVVLTGFESGEGVPVTFAFPGARGIDYQTQSFEALKLNKVELNYTSGVLERVRSFLEYAGQMTHGLCLVSGPVGTGKSYLIRAILTELTQRRAVVCTPPTQFLTEAGLLAQVVANFRRSVIVLEDIGDVIEIDAASRYMDARANLLNFTEGFLSLLTDAILILSFNYSIDKIDPAILRPGRCLANIEVDELLYEQAQKLIPFKVEKRAYSLAEIYEMKRIKGPSSFTKKEFGFSTGGHKK